jgi:predicted RecA/RadA family phage recombinase
MSATFIQNGDFLDHVPTADVPQGAIVVIGTLVGIAHRAIAAGTLGSIALTGVYALPIPAGSVAGAGDPVFYDPAVSQLVVGGGAPPGLPRVGLLVRPLTALDTTLRALLGW